MVEGFEATIWFYGDRQQVYCYSAEELIQKLRETKEEEIDDVELSLTCFEEMEKEEGISVLVSEWRKLTENERIQELSKLIKVGIFHYPNFDKETTIELKREVKASISRGIRFTELATWYLDDSMTAEAKPEALIEDLMYFFDPTLPYSVKKLDIEIDKSAVNSIEISGSKVKAFVENPEYFLELLSKRIFSSGQIEEMTINIQRRLRGVLDI